MAARRRTASSAVVFVAVALICFREQALSILVKDTVESEDQLPKVDPNTFDYPDYCLHYPFDPNLRASPPIADTALAAQLELDHVHLVFRHGARTPLLLGACWENFEPQWDCDYVETVSGSISTPTFPSDSGTISLPRVFDARTTDNDFGGTCAALQLLPEGAFQHQRIGRLLAENYLIADSNHKLPLKGSPPLLSRDLKLLSKQLWLRSTATSRTTHSLLNQVQAMLAHYIRRDIEGAQPNLPASAEKSAWADNPKAYAPRHRTWTPDEITRDLTLDQLLKMSLPPINTMDPEFETMESTNYPAAHCPLTANIAKEILTGAEFALLRLSNLDVISQWERITSQLMKGHAWPLLPFDCTLSHICAQQWLHMPEGLSPLSRNPQAAHDFVEALVDAATKEVNALYTLRNRAYSRFSVGSFLSDIRRRMRLTLDDEVFSEKRSRLHLWSTHDTGLTPLLVALMPNFTLDGWMSYASLLNLEVYRRPEARQWPLRETPVWSSLDAVRNSTSTSMLAAAEVDTAERDAVETDTAKTEAVGDETAATAAAASTRTLSGDDDYQLDVAANSTAENGESATDAANVVTVVNADGDYIDDPNDPANRDDATNGDKIDADENHIDRVENKLKEVQAKNNEKDAAPPYSQYYFRLIYNGKVVTPLVNGCSSELCPMAVFFNTTAWADDVDRMCKDAQDDLRRRVTRLPALQLPWPAVVTSDDADVKAELSQSGSDGDLLGMAAASDALIDGTKSAHHRERYLIFTVAIIVAASSAAVIVWRYSDYHTLPVDSTTAPYYAAGDDGDITTSQQRPRTLQSIA